jgi:dTDP-glucose pyrophosphorylase
MQGVILAAGKGSRLHPITVHRSKAMVPILGKPIVERVMETLVQNGIREFVMVVSREDGEVVRYFRDQSGLDVQIQFVVQPTRLGMANALSLAAPYLSDTFIMSACDNLVQSNHVAELLATHNKNQACATLSLMEVDPAVVARTGVVDLQNGRVKRIVEKPAPETAPSNIASLPLYVFSNDVLGCLPEVELSPRGEYELQDAIQMLIEQDLYVTGAFTDGRLQLTNADDLLSLNRHYLTTGGDTPQLAPRSVGKHTHLITPLRIEEGTEIGSGCVIGPPVILRNTVIEDGQDVVGRVVS